MQDQQQGFLSQNQALPTEQVLKKVGGNHLFQILIMLITALAASSGYQFLHSLTILQNRNLQLYCQDHSKNISSCTSVIACDSSLTTHYSFSHEDRLLNWVTTLDLVCTPDAQFQVIRYLPFIGIVVGALIFLPMSDLFGRKKLVLVGLLVFVTLCILALLIRNFVFLKVFLFMAGFMLPTIILIPYIHLLEFVHKDYRTYFGILVVGLYSGSYLIVALIFKTYQNWKVFYTVMTIESGLALITYTFLVPESPRFHIVELDFYSAKRVFNLMSYVNQKRSFKGHFIQEIQFQGDVPLIIQSRKSLKLNIYRLCKNAAKRMLILSLCVPLIVCTFQNSGVFIIIDDQEDQPYINYFVVGFGDILACLCFSFLANKIGRKNSILFGLGIASMTCFIYSFLHKNQTSTYITMISSRFANIGAFATLSLVSVESLLTEVRGTILGFILSMAYLCVMLVPSFSSVRQNFVATLAILEMLGFFVCFALPETLGKDMENSSIIVDT